MEDAAQGIVSEPSKRVSQLERTLNRYEREIAHLTQKSDRFSTQLNTLKCENIQLLAQVNELHSTLVKETADSASLREQLASAQQTINSTGESYAKLLRESLPPVNEEQLHRLQFELEKSEARESYQREENARISSQNENLKQSIAILHKQLALRLEDIKDQNISNQQQPLVQSQQLQALINRTTTTTPAASVTVTPSTGDSIEVSRLRAQIAERQKECLDLSASFSEQKSQFQQKLLTLQQTISQKDMDLHKQQIAHSKLIKQLEILSEQFKAESLAKNQISQQLNASNMKLEIESKQSNDRIEEKAREIQELHSQIERLNSQIQLLEDTSIPSEALNIKELTIKNKNLTTEITQLQQLNAKMTQTFMELQADLKVKTPLILKCKSDLEIMTANYQLIKNELARCENTIDLLAGDKQSLIDNIESLLIQKEVEEKVMEEVKQENLYLSYLLKQLKIIVIKNNHQFPGLNLLSFDVQYVRENGFRDLIQQNDFENFQTNHKSSIKQWTNSRSNIIGKDKLTSQSILKERSDFMATEIVRLKERLEKEIMNSKKLEQMNSIRSAVSSDKLLLAGEQQISKKENEGKGEIDLIKQRLKVAIDEREKMKLEVSKSSLERSRLNSEVSILLDRVKQTQALADLYQTKYETILKAQLRENSDQEATRASIATLKQSIAVLNKNNAGLLAENERIRQQLETFRLQVFSEKSTYIEQVLRKKENFEEELKAATELSKVRAQVIQQKDEIEELKQKNKLEIQLLKQQLKQQSIDSLQKYISQNIQIENYRLLSKQSTAKLTILNKIILEQQKEMASMEQQQHQFSLEGVRSKAQNQQMVSEEEEEQQLEIDLMMVPESENLMVDESQLRLDTQFLKNLNKMEQVVKEQKQEHTESLKSIQVTMNNLAETCIRLQDKLKEAEAADLLQAVKYSSLEAAHLADLDRKEAEYLAIQAQKQEQIVALEQRFQEYRMEQSLVQEDIRRKFEQEQIIMSENDENTFKFKRVNDEKEELELQLAEIKNTLIEIASERIVIEAAYEAEIKMYISQINSKISTTREEQTKTAESGESTTAESIQANTAQTDHAANTQIEIESQAESTAARGDTLLKSINDRDTQAQYLAKILALEQSEENLRRENLQLAKMKLTLQEELATTKTMQQEMNSEKGTREETEEKSLKQSETQTELELLRSQNSILAQKVQHLSRINESLTTEDASNINELVQNNGGFVELFEKLQKFIELKCLSNEIESH